MDIGSLTGAIKIEDQLTGVLETATHHVKNFATEFDGMVGAVSVGAFAIAGAVAGAVASIVALGDKGSIILGVEDAFDKLAVAAGSSGGVLVNALSEGVKDTVDSMELMQATTKLLTSGMKINEGDFKLMGSLAREMGKATGTDAADGLNTLSSALLTGNTRSLKRYGIQVDLVKAEKDFASSIGTTRDQLSQAGKLEADRVAILAAMKLKMDALGTSELSFRERIQQIKVGIGDWVDSLAKAVASSSHVMKAFDSISDAIKKAFGGTSQTLLDFIVRWIDKFADMVARYGPPTIVFLGKVRDGILEIWETVQRAWDLVPDWFKRVAMEAGGAAGAVYLTSKALGALGGGSDLLGTVASFATITSGLRDFTAIAISQVPKAITQIKGLYDALKVYYLLGSFAGGGVIGGIGGLLTGIGAGMMALAATPVGIAALFTGLAASIWQVVRAIQAFGENWKAGGGTLWGFLTLKDDDNFVRRWLGLSTGIDTTTESVKKFMATRKDMEAAARGLGHGTDTAEGLGFGAGGDPSLIVPEVTAYDNVVKSVKELSKSLDVAEKHHVSLAEKVRLYGSAASQASQDATTWGVKVAKSVQQVADIFDNKELQQEIRGVTSEIGVLAKKIETTTKELDKEFFAEVHDIIGEIYSTEQKVQQVMDDFDVTSIKGEIEGLGQGIDHLADKASTLGEALTNTLSGIPETLRSAFEGGGGIGGALRSIATQVGENFGKAMSDAIKKQLASETGSGSALSGKSLGASAGVGVLGGIGAASSGGSGKQQVGQVASIAAGVGVSASLAGASIAASAALAGVTAGIGLAIVGAIALYKHLHAARNAIKDFAKQFDTVAKGTGFDELRTRMLALGDSGEQMWINLTQRSKSKSEVTKNINAINEALAKLDEDLQKYNLTWSDMAHAQAGGTKAGTALADSYKRLSSAGYSTDAIIKAMGGDLNAFIANSLAAGTKIPSALQPIIEKLIESKGLTEANARAMLGYAETSMPALADIKDAADRYGISLDELGPKVKQLEIAELATQYVADWKVLTAATDDWGVLFDKMGPKVQDLVSDAMHYGSELPASMKPMIQAFVDAGRLTDDTGEKLTDLSKLTFAADLSEMFEGLMSKLDELIDKITVGVGGALSKIGSTVVHPRVIPTYDEPSGTSEPPSEAPGYASGGRVIAFTPRGTDTVPAMLTPGETVIPAGRSSGYVAEVAVPLNVDGVRFAEAMVRVSKRI